MPRKHNRLNDFEPSPLRRRTIKHNSFRGMTAQMRGQLKIMLASDSLTGEARLVAGHLMNEVAQLEQLLKERKDP
jgi:hypothetical protein